MSVTPASKNYVVYIFGWDLFPLPGVTAAVSSGLGLPKEYLHVGIGVYNRLYHFTQDGVNISLSMPQCYKVLRGTESEMEYGITNKLQMDLEKWVDEQGRGAFNVGRYNVNTNNCICFARGVCEFLGVSFEGPQVTLQAYLETSPLANSVLEPLRENKALQFLASAASKTSVSKPQKINVGETIINVFSVQGRLEKQYSLSNSGARYEKSDASIVPS